MFQIKKICTLKKTTLAVVASFVIAVTSSMLKSHLFPTRGIRRGVVLERPVSSTSLDGHGVLSQRAVMAEDEGGDTLPSPDRGGVSGVEADDDDDTLQLPRDDIIVSLMGVPAKHVRSRRFLRTVKCSGSQKTITFKDSTKKKKYPEKAEIILQKEMLLAEADVIVFTKTFPVTEWQRMVKNRNPRQIWLYTTAESAFASSPTSSRKPEVEGLKFNVTFGYHSKSDVYSPFGEYLPYRGRNVSKEFDRNIWAGKPSDEAPVVWTSSHCSHSYWNRTALVYYISKYIDVQMYGMCGNHKIPRDASGSTIMQKHKFYLAFENSCCSEYITEKFWKALAEYEAVPIVIGAKKSELLRLAPRNSFIYADDFKTAKDLATYIETVAEDADMYNKYHEWRNHGKVEVYLNTRVYPYWHDESACVLLRYLEANAWKGKAIVSKIDPYGPDWIGSCKACGENKWIQMFGQTDSSFLPPDP